MRDLYIKNYQGFIFVYSIDNDSGLEYLKDMKEQIIRIKEEWDPKYNKDNFNKLYPCVLIGNKSDIEDKRMVSKEKGEELAKFLGCNFYETSAKESINVNEAFNDIIRQYTRNIDYKSIKEHKKEGCLLS
jgi:GTPase SAR1 family protein